MIDRTIIFRDRNEIKHQVLVVDKIMVSEELGTSETRYLCTDINDNFIIVNPTDIIKFF